MTCENCRYYNVEDSTCGRGDDPVAVSAFDKCRFPGFVDAYSSNPTIAQAINLAAEKMNLDAQEPFNGDTMNSAKEEICIHILNMAQQIDRMTKDITIRSDDTEDSTLRHWTLSMDLRAPSFFLNDGLKKRICEMILAADMFGVAIVENTNNVRFTFGVHDLWE